MKNTRMLSWNDRFALIDHHCPTDAQICKAFGVTPTELSTAKELRRNGIFSSTVGFNVANYENVFLQSEAKVSVNTRSVATNPISSQATTTATVHTKPETATKQPKVPQKRGRKGNKIATAFAAVPTTPVPVSEFIAKHGVSLSVLRQSKRFIETMDAQDVSRIGKINVRQDKTTHTLMIWRDVDGN